MRFLSIAIRLLHRARVRTRVRATGLFFIALSLLSAVAHSVPQEKSEFVDFEREVWPILVQQCIDCHGPEEQQGQLRLDSRAAAFHGGVSGPLFEKSVTESLLLHRLTTKDADERMPFENAPLTQKQIDVIERWIAGGHDWPEHVGTDVSLPQNHWAYSKPALSVVPHAGRSGDTRHPIDCFIRDRLSQEGLIPNPPAAPAVLVRRLYLDLIGLPPPIEEVERFVRDPSTAAYHELVDRLLSSSRFGEKWSRDWLDLARYSDSNGYQADQLRDLWPYRDWVISAMNADMPYDQFTIEQLAGDLLPNATDAQKIATGFHRTPTCNIEAGVDPEENRTNQVIDRVNTTATVWLGTTLECAQCHNHKYDPFTQKDYYRLFAFFNNTPLEVENTRQDGIQFDFYGPRMELASNATMREQWHMLDAEIEVAQESLQRAERESMIRYPEWKQKVIEQGIQPTASLTAATLKEFRQWLSEDSTPTDAVKEEKIKEAFWKTDSIVRDYRQKVDALLRDKKNVEPKTTLVMLEMESPRITRIFKRGNFLTPTQQVAPGAPAALHPLPSETSPDRLGLAKWLIDKENPLTARVRVNQIWEEIFGLGLVASGEDFGVQGSPPSHPKLLDWLAVRFVQDEWSTKRLLRQIVTTATYQQSSQQTLTHQNRDPKNIFLARGSRFRLPAELIRDNGLAIANLLEEKMGGPPIYPPQPPRIWRQTGRGEPVYRVAQGPDRYRRGVYVIWRRVAPYPSFVNFDAPDRTRCVVERSTTNTPLQALTLLNDEAYLEMARGLANRILEAELTDDRTRLLRAFQLCVARSPSEEDLSILQGLLNDQRQSLQEFPSDALKLVGTLRGKKSEQTPEKIGERAAWVCVANTLLNLDETITKE